MVFIDNDVCFRWDKNKLSILTLYMKIWLFQIIRNLSNYSEPKHGYLQNWAFIYISVSSSTRNYNKEASL